MTNFVINKTGNCFTRAENNDFSKPAIFDFR